MGPEVEEANADSNVVTEEKPAPEVDNKTEEEGKVAVTEPKKKRSSSFLDKLKKKKTNSSDKQSEVITDSNKTAETVQ